MLLFYIDHFAGWITMNHHIFWLTYTWTFVAIRRLSVSSQQDKSDTTTGLEPQQKIRSKSKITEWSIKGQKKRRPELHRENYSRGGENNYFQHVVKCCNVIVWNFESSVAPAVVHSSSCFHWLLKQSPENYGANSTSHLASAVISSRVSWNWWKMNSWTS